MDKSIWGRFQADDFLTFEVDDKGFDSLPGIDELSETIRKREIKQYENCKSGTYNVLADRNADVNRGTGNNF